MKRKTKKTKDNLFSLEELNELLKRMNQSGCDMIKAFEEQPEFFDEESEKILTEQVQWHINRIKTLIKEKNETHPS